MKFYVADHNQNQIICYLRPSHIRWFFVVRPPNFCQPIKSCVCVADYNEFQLCLFDLKMLANKLSASVWWGTTVGRKQNTFYPVFVLWSITQQIQFNMADMDDKESLMCNKKLGSVWWATIKTVHWLAKNWGPYDKKSSVFGVST